MTATVPIDPTAGHHDEGHLTAWSWAEERSARDRITDAVRAAGRVVGESPRLARAGADLAVELGKVVVGKSDVEPGKGDRRFSDPTWTDHFGYRRLMQGYLAASNVVERVVEDTDVPWRTKEQLRFAAGVLTSSLAPTNTLLGNPAAVKRAFETAGGSLRTGARNWVDDLRHNGGMPKQVDDSGYVVGENLAASPGAVVFRNEVLELIQYAPSTEQVRTVPVMVVPPQINKYYFVDLAPGRSLVQHAVSRGLTMFMVSWRNPGPAQGDWDLDTYATALLEATEVVRQVSNADELITLGLCAGGITTATLLSYLAEHDPSRVRACAFSVTLLDWDSPAAIGAFRSRRVLALTRTRGKKNGVLDARSLGSVFTWMRPNDLVWNYWVNNYLMGNKPPAFDILAWNEDKTNLPAALHAQFLDMFEHNILTHPKGVEVLGHGVDLSSVKIDSYVIGGLSDHLTPWQGCYRTTQLLGGDSTFVLSPTGHIQTPVSPPGPKAFYFTGPKPGPDAEAWRAAATKQTGSWWDHWADWVIARAGDERPARTDLGSERYPVLGAAPGTYVHQPA